MGPLAATPRPLPQGMVNLAHYFSHPVLILGQWRIPQVRILVNLEVVLPESIAPAANPRAFRTR